MKAIINDTTTDSRVERIAPNGGGSHLVWVSGTSAEDVNEMANRACHNGEAEYVTGSWSDEVTGPGDYRFYGVYRTAAGCWYGGGYRVNYAPGI